MATKITWDRKDRRIWTAVADVRFERGLASVVRPVAFRIAPEDIGAQSGRYVVDRKSLSFAPWENAGGTRTFPTKAAAARFAVTLANAMGAQNEWHPKLDVVAS